jgi:hypothetical protein
MLPEAMIREAAAAHGRICDRYLARFGGLPGGMPALTADPAEAAIDDGYSLRFLAHHLVRAGRLDDLHTMLAADSPSVPGPSGIAVGAGTRNVWFAAHDFAADMPGYLKDVRLARETVGSIGMQLRYDLIETSVATLATALPSVLLGELVDRGGWSVQRAFAYIERMTDEGRQAEALAVIASQLPDDLLGRALLMASRFKSEKNSVTVLKKVVSRIPGRLIDDALEVVLASCRWVLPQEPVAAIISRLPRQRLGELVHHRAWAANHHLRAIHAFFSCGSPAEGLRRALAAVEGPGGDENKDLILSVLAPYAPAEVFDDVLEMLAAVTNPERSLAALAAHAPAMRLDQLISFAAAKQPSIGFIRNIASRLSEEHAPGALKLTLAFTLAPNRAEAFTMIAPALDDHMVGQLLAPAKPSENGTLSIRDGKPVGDYRSGFAVADFLQISDSSDEKYQFLAVGALLKRLPTQEARVLTEEVILPLIYKHARRKNAGWAFSDEVFLVAEYFTCVAPYITSDLRRQALQALGTTMGWSESETRSIAPFLAHFGPLTDSEIALLFSQLENSIMTSWWPESGIAVANVLAPNLTRGQLNDVLDRIRRFPVEQECFAALASLGLQQAPDARHGTAARALATASAGTHARSQARAVVRLAPIIDPSLTGAAVALLKSVNPFWGVSAIDDVADMFPADELAEVCRLHGHMLTDMKRGIPKSLTRLSREGHGDVIDGLLQDKSGGLNYAKVDRLAPILSAEQALRCWDRQAGPDALAAFARLLPEDRRAAAVDEVLVLYAPRLPGAGSEREARTLALLAQAASTEKLTESLRVILRGSGSGRPSSILKEIAPCLPDSLLEVALQFALSSNFDCCWALAELAPRLSGALLDQAIAHARGHELENGRAKAMTALASRVPPGDDQRAEIVAVALDAATSWPGDSESVMVQLIPQLPEDLRPQAVEEVIRHLRLRLGASDEPDPALSALRSAELQQVYARLASTTDPLERARARAIVLRHAGRGRHQAFSADQALHNEWAGRIDRASLADLIDAAAWWIKATGGENDVQQVVDAILDTAAWWP